MLREVRRIIPVYRLCVELSDAPLSPAARPSKRLPLSPFEKVISTTMVENDDDSLPTPPLTRPPSGEFDELDETPLPGVIIFPSTEAEHHTEEAGGSWLRSLTAAIMLAVRFLASPSNARARPGCWNGGDDDDEDDAHPSLWKRAKDAVRKALKNAKKELSDVGERFRRLFDDPVARCARLVDLANAFGVRDLPRRTGHKRHDSGELFECDRKRLKADETVTAGVKQICSQVVHEFPEVGYNQVNRLSNVCVVLLLLAECGSGWPSANVASSVRWSIWFNRRDC